MIVEIRLIRPFCGRGVTPMFRWISNATVRLNAWFPDREKIRSTALPLDESES